MVPVSMYIWISRAVCGRLNPVILLGVRHGSRHAASCLVEHTLAPPAIAAQTRTFRRGLSGKFDGIAQFQKLVDLIAIQYLGGLHTYLHSVASVAARLLIHLHLQYHLAVDNSERPPALPVM